VIDLASPAQPRERARPDLSDPPPREAGAPAAPPPRPGPLARPPPQGPQPGAALPTAAEDPAVRAIVLTGACGAFCAGAYIKAAMSNGMAAFEGLDAIIDQYHAIIRAITGAPKPVLAAVDGCAVGVRSDFNGDNRDDVVWYAGGSPAEYRNIDLGFRVGRTLDQ